MLPSAAAALQGGATAGASLATKPGEFLEADAPYGSTCWAWLEPTSPAMPFVLVSVRAGKGRRWDHRVHGVCHVLA